MIKRSEYINGKSFFIVSLIVIGVTVLVVYLTGIKSDRALYSNWYISLGIIAFALFSFMNYILYKGLDVKDNFKQLESSNILGEFAPEIESPEISGVPDIDGGDGLGGIIVSIFLWLFISVVAVYLLVFFGTLLWFLIMIIIGILYWLFFRALKLVAVKSILTKGNMNLSLIYSSGYTLLFVGWIFGLVYLSQSLN